MPERAWVSTSSVRNTFVTPSRWMRLLEPLPLEVRVGCSLMVSVEAMMVGFWSFSALSWLVRLSVKSNALVGVHRAGIGKDDLVAGFEAADDLDSVHRAAAEFHRRADRLGSSGDEFENTDGVVLLAKGRAADVDHII